MAVGEADGRTRGGGYFRQYGRDRGERARVTVRLGVAEADRQARDGRGRGGRAGSWWPRVP